MRPLIGLLKRFLVGLIVVIGLTVSATAQITDADRAYHNNWLKTALRAEAAIDSRKASNAAFEELRRELVEYRLKFQTTRTENGNRLATLEAQLAALGPPPEEGRTEADDISQLRFRLTQQINQLKVPRIVSDEAFNRADGLIREIDSIIRDRRTKRLLERSPVPINPEYWPAAATVLSKVLLTIWHETELQVASDTTAERFLDNLPAITFLGLVSLLFLLRGRPWARAAGDFLRGYGARGTGVWTFVVSLLHVVLPLVGVVLLSVAIELTGLVGVRGALLLEPLPYWAFILLAFHWIGERLYSNRSAAEAGPADVVRLGETRFLIDALALVFVGQDVLSQLAQLDNFDAATRSVLSFPLIVTGALVMVRLQRIGLKQRDTATSPEDGDGKIAQSASRLLSFLRRGVFLLAFVSPILAVFGYINAAEALIYPAISTLALIATLLIVHRFIGDLYGWMTRKGAAAQDSLFVVAVGFALTLLAVPLLALIWGARVADLTELWSTFLEGFQIGDAKISPVAFLSFAIIFAVGYTLTRLVQGALRTSLLPKTRIDPGGQNAIVSGTGYVGIFLAALVAISMAGLDLSSLAIVAGALSVGIGFGLQTIVSNFVSGIILLVERPVSKGDWIEVGGLMGYVRDISVRSTRIETFDRTDVIVPNSDLITGTVTNYTRGNTVGRVIVPVGVAYGTDPRRVEAILLEIAKAHPMVLMNPAPNVVFQGFGADSLDFEIRAILRDVNWVLTVKSDMNYEIARRFEEEKIEIPFAQRDIWLRNPEVLHPDHRSSPNPPRGTEAIEPIQSSDISIEPDLDDLAEVSPDNDD